MPGSMKRLAQNRSTEKFSRPALKIRPLHRWSRHEARKPGRRSWQTMETTENGLAAASGPPLLTMICTGVALEVA